jgi:hypothetical protein
MPVHDDLRRFRVVHSSRRFGTFGSHAVSIRTKPAAQYGSRTS